MPAQSSEVDRKEKEVEWFSSHLPPRLLELIIRGSRACSRSLLFLCTEQPSSFSSSRPSPLYRAALLKARKEPVLPPVLVMESNLRYGKQRSSYSYSRAAIHLLLRQKGPKRGIYSPLLRIRIIDWLLTVKATPAHV